MRSTYVDVEHWATVSLMWPHGRQLMLVSNVEVNRRFRGYGHASRLMRLMIEDADREDVVLGLTIAPDGTGLDSEILNRWYERLGFADWLEHPGAMIRQPRNDSHPMIVIVEGELDAMALNESGIPAVPVDHEPQ